ncbi:peptigoglycan-binding protein LysM [Sporosarcina globispora]|uniref:Peptigoglycan-binding protein LysM n=1 Tax=Sporosarcina globispora TaxID=1459 RepID=A0A0M0G883_SPOGL|nr:glycosyltransferase [Sporosarcina globispora]KON85963.1 peptigoglycan-binding protein LysM [Sporosarcina globispora]
MRVLFLESHPMWIYGLPNGFKDAGHKVMISGSLTKQNISEMTEQFKPDLIISMGWTEEHYKIKQTWIHDAVKKNKIPLIYWATEDPLHTKKFSIPLIKRMKPDFVFTVTPSMCELYKDHGFKSAHLDFAYHNSVHHRVEPLEKYRCDIAVVANAYPDFILKNPDSYRLSSLQTLISPLLKKNIRVDFWGNNWDAMEDLLGRKIPSDWNHGYLDYREAHKVYSSAKIVIGIQNCIDQLTQRTYETLGSEAFLITSKTPAVMSKFKHNRDLAISSSPKETVKLIKYYLKNNNIREQIRTQAKTALTNDTYQHRAQQIIKVLIDHGILSNNVKSTTAGEVIHYPELLKQKYEIHVVKNGDTLFEISQKYGVDFKKIMKLNHLESDLIEVGMLLKINRKNLRK